MSYRTGPYQPGAAPASALAIANSNVATNTSNIATNTAAIAAQRALTSRNDLGFYVPPGWGSFWYPKLAAAQAGTGKAVVAFAGHSIMRGYYTSYLGKGFAGLLTALLQAGADGGSGYQNASDTKVHEIAAGFTSGQVDPWDVAGTGENIVLTGTWGACNDGVGQRLYDGPGAVYVYTTQPGAVYSQKVRGTTIKVYTIQETVGTDQLWAVTIDGVAKTGISRQASAGVYVTTYTVSAGTHQVVLTYTGPALTDRGIVCGISGEYATGVVCNMFARPAAVSVELSNTVTAPSGTYGPAGLWSGGPNYPADLVIIGNEMNDVFQGLSMDTALKNLRGYLDGVRGSRSATSTGATDILVILSHAALFDPNGISSEYAQKVRSLCEHYGAALVNFTAIARNSFGRWLSAGYFSTGRLTLGASATNVAAMNGDQGHPGDTGHVFMGNTLAPLLTGVAGSTVSSTGLTSLGNTAGTAAAATTPSKVLGVTLATPVNSTITVTWSEPASGGAAITDYTVQYRVVGAGSWTTFSHTASTTRTASITGLSAGSSYEVQVAAVNSAGTGTFSDIAGPQSATYALTTWAADTFTRADSATVGSTETGSFAWTALFASANNSTPVPSISSNQLLLTTGATTVSEIYEVVDTGHADGTLQATFVTAATVSGGTRANPCLVFRCSDNNNLWLFGAGNVTGYQLFKKVAGTYTQVGTTSGTNALANDVVKVVLNGTSITCYVNGAQIFSVTDAANQAGTKHGLRAASLNGIGGGVRFDSFTHTSAVT